MKRFLAVLISFVLTLNAFADGGLIADFSNAGVPMEASKLVGESRGAALTAAGNSSQANAYAIVNSVNTFTTVTAASADSARLPTKAVVSRDDILVQNSGAGVLQVYPPTGGVINGLATNAPFSVQSGGVAIFKRVSNTAWAASGISVVQSLSNPASGTAATTIANSATIGSALPFQRVTNAGAVTGIIITDGVINGQLLTILVDKDAVGSVTFAAEATSNVCGGTAVVIAVGAGATFVYDATDTCWSAVGIGTV